MRTLYVFLDESGNFDFSSKGTNHFVLAAVTALDPLVSSQSLQALKYDLLAGGVDVECFHASPDQQATRDRVFGVIEKLTDIRMNFIYADKHKNIRVIKARRRSMLFLEKRCWNTYLMAGRLHSTHSL